MTPDGVAVQVIKKMVKNRLVARILAVKVARLILIKFGATSINALIIYLAVAVAAVVQTRQILAATTILGVVSALSKPK
jgi:hypothetical protein